VEDEEGVPSGRKIRGVFTVRCRLDVVFGKNKGSFSLYTKQSYLFSRFSSQIRGIPPSI
jgi:hypothetical protein